MLHVCASGSIKIGELINGFFSFSDYCELFLCVFNTEGKKRRLLHFLTVVDFNLTLLNLLMEESFVSCGVKDSLALQHVNPPLLAFSDRFPLSLFPFIRCPFPSLVVGVVPKRFFFVGRDLQVGLDPHHRLRMQMPAIDKRKEQTL